MTQTIKKAITATRCGKICCLKSIFFIGLGAMVVLAKLNKKLTGMEISGERNYDAGNKSNNWKFFAM